MGRSLPGERGATAQLLDPGGVPVALGGAAGSERQLPRDREPAQRVHWRGGPLREWPERYQRVVFTEVPHVRQRSTVSHVHAHRRRRRDASRGELHADPHGNRRRHHAHHPRDPVRDGLLDLFVCNYVKWSLEADIFCSLDGKHKSYCTPEAYRGATCWLFHNRGNGTFEDVTATSGIFDSSSKSLGVALLDENRDGWPDLLVANDTQPNKLYRNQHNGTFKDAAVEAGIAFSSEGKARAGMGVDVADFDNSGTPGVAITNFDNEMIGLYRLSGKSFEDIAPQSGVGIASRNSLGFGCSFLDVNLDGWLDFAVANGHIDETVRNIRGNVGYAQPPQLFLNGGKGTFREVAAEAGEGFDRPKVGRGLAYADFDRDGDLDLLITTNNGPANLYRNDHLAGNRSIRFQLVGTKSNRDAIGATVRIFAGGMEQLRVVKGGSSYLSQSELPVTFGVERRDRIDRMVIDWPSGLTEEFKNLAVGRAYDCTEGKGIVPRDRY